LSDIPLVVCVAFDAVYSIAIILFCLFISM
jgi:hypothetical protein